MIRWIILMLFLMLCWNGAMAGAQVMAEFQDKRAKSPEVLAHVPLKAVVAEYLDPFDSGLGKSLGYLIWREVLTAISDQAGAGVIVAEAPPGERLVDLLKQDYHIAAERIARHQKARMVIWGVVSSDNDELAIQTYLSLLTDDKQSGLKFGLGSKVIAGPSRWLEEQQHTRIEADLAYKRFNFDADLLTRNALFDRTLVTSARVDIKTRPDKNSRTLRKLAANKAIRAVDMTGAWFKVALPEGGFGYLNAGTFGKLRLPPREVSGTSNRVNLRNGPGTDHAVVATRNLGREPMRVLDMRYREGHGLWYRIDLGTRDSWVAAWLVKPRFSLPVIDFVAGLYRYYGERHEQAIDAFSRYIDSSDPLTDNVNLAAAFQLRGASRILAIKTDGNGNTEGYRDFSRAIELTPYNPNAFLLRSVANLGMSQPKAALADLDKALSLDREYRPARKLATTFKSIADKPGMSPLGIMTRLPQVKTEVDKLTTSHRIEQNVRPIPERSPARLDNHQRGIERY
ncbi:MAG: SH3 domain-containing protein [Candidatus Thiodiazotropha sp.]